MSDNLPAVPSIVEGLSIECLFALRRLLIVSVYFINSQNAQSYFNWLCRIYT